MEVGFIRHTKIVTLKGRRMEIEMFYQLEQLKYYM